MGNLNDDKVGWKLIHHVVKKVTFCILTRNINFHHLHSPIYIVEHALKFVITCLFRVCVCLQDLFF